MVLRSVGLVLGLLLGVSVVAAQAPGPADFAKLKEDTVKKWSGVDVLLVGKITEVVAGPVGLSNPPLRTYKLTLKADSVLRGDEKFEKPVTVNYSIRQNNEPAFPAGDKATMFGLQQSAGAWTLVNYDEASPDTIAQAKLAAALPLGWTVREGKLLSPWATGGKAGKGEGVACSVTGRPALHVGSGVGVSVESVPPKVAFQFKNPDGDGEYKITVKNLTDADRTVPALLTDGKDIRWADSVVLRCEGKTYTLPGSTGDVGGLKPVVLKPGEAVSGTVNAFVMDGPAWPRGGSRIGFQFCLGEKSVTQSFYYFSNHHDPIRAAVQQGLKK